MNIAILSGRLTKDPELRYLPSNGTAVCYFSIAVDKELSSEKRSEFESKGQATADFINIVTWGRLAEISANNLNKGKMCTIKGRMQVRSYDAKDGTKRYATEVVADRVEFQLDKKENDLPPGFVPCNDDDIPF